MSIAKLETNILVINLENLPVMAERIKQRHLTSLSGWENTHTAILYWKGVQDQLIHLDYKEQNVLLEPYGKCHGKILFLTATLGLAFCREIIKLMDAGLFD